VLPTPLDAIEGAFAALLASPTQPAVDGAIAGLPHPLRLEDARAVLRDPATPYETRDGIVAYLARRAKAGQDDWTIALAGVLLPGLRRAAARVAGSAHGTIDRGDVDGEIVAGLLEGLAELDLSGSRLPARLCGAAYNRARRARDAALNRAEHEHRMDAPPMCPRADEQPQHPDLVLAAAVEAGVIDRTQAEVIGTTRIDEVSLRDLAPRLDTNGDTLGKRRRVAERRLVAWLLRGVDGRPVSDSRLATASSKCGSLRGSDATAGDPESHRCPQTEKGGDAPYRPLASPGSRPAPSTTNHMRSQSPRERQSPQPAPWPAVPPCWWPVPSLPPLRTRPARRRSTT